MLDISSSPQVPLAQVQLQLPPLAFFPPKKASRALAPVSAVRKVPFRTQKNRSPTNDPRKKGHVPAPPKGLGEVDIRA
jgi:hypothetical protein